MSDANLLSMFSSPKVCVQNNEEIALSILPTEAQLVHDPYPFGLDPVRDVCMYLFYDLIVMPSLSLPLLSLLLSHSLFLSLPLSPPRFGK